MTRITLNRLEIRDFQGGTFVLDTQGGEDASVLAKNGAGKTRLVSAFSWLMFGKDALGRSDFAIKNLDALGQPEHNVEHTVEAVLGITGPAENRTVTAKKVYREKYQKKRGSAQAEFAGHTTDYYWDGVPVQEKDFQARVADLVGDEMRFRLLTSPTVFPNLPADKGVPGWQRQRAILMEVCGDVDDAQIIASDTRLAPLTELLTPYRNSRTPMSDLKKVIAARRTEINRELEKLPVRIDEVRRGLPDVQGLDREAIAAGIQRVEHEIGEKKLRLQGVDTGSGIAELSKQLAGVEADIRQLETRHYTDTMAAANRLSQQAAEVQTGLSSAQRKVADLGADIMAKTARLKAIDGDLDALRRQWAVIDGQAFQDTSATACAACGQDLPAERVQAAREKAMAAFNTERAERLAENERRGRALREEADRLSVAITSLTAERDALADGIPVDTERLAGLTADRDGVKRAAEDYTAIPGRAELLATKSELEAQIRAEREGRAPETERLRGEIADLERALSADRERSDRFVRRESGEKRIADLMADEKRLAREFEALEHQLYLCEQFVRTKVSLLTDRINSRFEIVRFKLFNELVNGGLEECCEITVGGVPYNAGLNNAARIQAGLDVIRTLQEHYGVRPVVFVDNRESVTELPAMQCQIISLVVSPEDKILRVEKAVARQAVAA